MTVLQYPMELDGVVTRVLECGTGDDVVLCLHGAGARADRWRGVVERLAEHGRHAYAIDFPGHGMAAKPVGYPYGKAAFTRVALDFIDRIESPSIALAGTSIGGHVAALAALDRAERVRALMLFGSRIIDVPHTTEVGSNIANVGESGIRAKLELLVYDPTQITDEWVREEHRINSSPGAAEALAALRSDNESYPPDGVAVRLRDLAAPILLGWGADDRWVVPEIGREVQRQIPAAPLVLIEKTGHAPMLERPDVVGDALHQFLDDPKSFGESTVLP